MTDNVQPTTNQPPTANQSIPEEHANVNWIEEESKLLARPTGERLPALKLEENKIADFTVDFSQPFQKWNNVDKNGEPVTKAIIPVTDHKDKDTKKTFWLSVRNPLYLQLLTKAKTGMTRFKVIQVGNQANTKYNLVE